MALQLIDELGLYMVIFAEPVSDPHIPTHLEAWSLSYRTLNEIIHAGPEDVIRHQIKYLLLENHIQASQANYRAWLLCALVPWANERAKSRMEAPKKSSKGYPSMAAMAVKHGLKGAGTEMVDLAENACRHSQAIKKATSENIEGALGNGLRTKKGDIYVPCRVKQGKELRTWGPGWRDNVMYALLVEVAQNGTSEIGDRSRFLY